MVIGGVEAREGGEQVVVTGVNRLREAVRSLVVVKNILTEIAHDRGVGAITEIGLNGSALTDVVMVPPFDEAARGINGVVVDVSTGPALILDISRTENADHALVPVIVNILGSGADEGAPFGVVIQICAEAEGGRDGDEAGGLQVGAKGAVAAGIHIQVERGFSHVIGKGGEIEKRHAPDLKLGALDLQALVGFGFLKANRAGFDIGREEARLGVVDPGVFEGHMLDRTAGFLSFGVERPGTGAGFLHREHAFVGIVADAIPDHAVTLAHDGGIPKGIGQAVFLIVGYLIRADFRRFQLEAGIAAGDQALRRLIVFNRVD